MSMNRLAEIWESWHPALKEVNYIHWCDLEKAPYNRSVILCGTEIACALMKKRFEMISIQPAGYLYFDPYSREKVEQNTRIVLNYGKKWDNLIYVVALQDFPGDEKNYTRIRDYLFTVGIRELYVIHDFSASFAMGAECVWKERQMIEKAFRNLSDDKSRERLVSFLKTINKPFHWNMDIKKENFGIPDPNRYGLTSEWEDLVAPSEVTTNSRMIFCGLHWNNSTPFFNWSSFFDYSLYMLPDQLCRLKFRQYIGKNKQQEKIGIISECPSNNHKGVYLEKEQFTGGTPIKYKTRMVFYNTVTIDSVAREIGGNTNYIIIDMDMGFIEALGGALQVIKSVHPIIMVTGFSRANMLWSSINYLSATFPNYSLNLLRFATENILQGYVIQLTPIV